MKTKLLIITTVFIGVASILVLTKSGVLPKSQSIAVHAQSDASAGFNPVTTNRASSPSSPMAITALKATKDGLTVEITKYDLNPDYPTVTICADLPSVADWLPIFSATYNGQPVDVWQVMLIDPQNDASQKKNRCYLAMLKEGIFQPGQSGTLIFNLEQFQMSIPEILPDDLLAKVKKNLKDKALDIDFEMKSVDHGQVVVIKKKPSALTDEQVYQAIQEAIAQAPEKVQGPWTFVIDVNP